MSERKRFYRQIGLLCLALTGGITVFACRLTTDGKSSSGRDEMTVATDVKPIQAPAATLHLKVSGITKSSGSLKVALFADGQGYPDHKQAARVQSFDLPQVTGSVTLDPVPPGNYAMAVYHDVNGDGKMNRAAVGYPTEPYGFSNNARATFGPPDYVDAAFQAVDGTQDLSIEIR